MEHKYFESLYPDVSWDSELEKVVSFIKEGNSCQIIGLPGIGRSNVLGLLAYNKAVRLRHFPKYHASVHFVMLNFSEVRQRSYTDVLKFIFLCLTNSLREREMGEEYERVDSLFKEALSYNDELVYTQYLKSVVEYLAIEKKLTIVFLGQNFDQYIPQASSKFFLLLRSLRDRAKYRFFTVFSLSRPLEDVLGIQVLADFSDYIIGRHIYLPLLDEPSMDFRISYLEKITGEKIPNQTKKEIVYLAGGHMRLLIASLEAVLAAKLDIAEMADSLLRVQTVHIALGDIWQSLLPEEQRVLLRGQENQEGMVNLEHSKTTNDYLTKIGIVRDGKIHPPLLADALIRGLFKENQAKFSYDEAGNVIKRGEVIFSDSLTKAEFRLFRYLLQHIGEVVDREIIISTVWREDKSSEGISDQAIDQLLFRLRKKIEVDPNHPQLLQTLKGRGVKFSQ